MLVFRGVHVAPELVGSGPERGLEAEVRPVAIGFRSLRQVFVLPEASQRTPAYKVAHEPSRASKG